MRAPFPVEPRPAILLSFILGIISAGIFPQNSHLFFWLTTASLVSATIVGVRNDQGKFFFSFFIVLFFFFFGISHTQRYQNIPSSDISRFQTKRPILVQGTVVNNPAEENGRTVVRLESIVEPINIRPVSGNLLLEFKGESAPLYYGDRLRARLIVKRPERKNNFDYPAYLAQRRIYAVAYPKKADLSVIGAERPGRILLFSFRLRRYLREKLSLAVTEEPQTLILEAMSFGLNQPKSFVKEPFRKIGIYHLLVVSGFNVAFFLLFLNFILSPFPIHPRLRALCCLPAIFLFTLACGLAAPVVRAGLMAGFYYLGKALNRSGKPLYALSFAAFFLLLVNPLSLFNAGWQLTFGITLGLIVGAERVSGYFLRLPRWLAAGLSAAVIGQLAAAPLIAFHFGNIPVISILVNLFFVPFAALLVFESFLVILPGIPATLFGPAALFLSTVFYRLSDLVSRLPFVSIEVPTGKYYYFLGYVPLAVILLFGKKKERKRDM